MAPALPELAGEYGSTILFWVCEAHAKRAARYYEFVDSRNDTFDLFPLSWFISPYYCAVIRNVWPQMGKLSF